MGCLPHWFHSHLHLLLVRSFALVLWWCLYTKLFAFLLCLPHFIILFCSLHKRLHFNTLIFGYGCIACTTIAEYSCNAEYSRFHFYCCSGSIVFRSRSWCSLYSKLFGLYFVFCLRYGNRFRFGYKNDLSISKWSTINDQVNPFRLNNSSSNSSRNSNRSEAWWWRERTTHTE